MNRAYVYAIFRPDGVVCYIGKGPGERWKRHDRRASDNRHLSNIRRAAGGSLPVVILHEGLSDEIALQYEIALIRAIGREEHGGPLVNKTDGGEGTTGARMTPEWRAIRAQRAREVWQDPEYREKQRQKRLGNTRRRGKRHSEEWKAANAQRMRGNTHTLGYRHTDEARAKMSAARAGVPKSEAHRAAIGAALRKRKIT